METQLVAIDLADEAAVSLDAALPHRKAVIALAADLLASNAGMYYEEARNALAAREALGTTAIGHGVALPHALSASCLRPAIALIRLASPISYGGNDRTGTDIVLAILWPSSEAKSFQQAAGEFCRMLRDANALHSIRRATSAAEIRQVMKRFCPLPAER